jgi:DNA-binding MarR family transcriptional regulator
MDATTARLYALLQELTRAIGMLHHSLPGEPITLSQVFALHELDQGRPLSQQELAERLGLDKSSVSRLAADMETKGLLVRERDPANRRFYRLRLTDQGRAYHARAGAAFRERVAPLLDAMTAAERAALVKGLGGLIRVMREHDAGSA